MGVSAEVAQRKVEILSRMRVMYLRAEDLSLAIDLPRLKQISFWDALIVQAARVAGAEVLISEDFSGGSMIGGVRTVNPFTA